MDTNICLYCEKPLKNNSGNSSFCSRKCHANEASKTQLPGWVTPLGGSWSRIRKAKIATRAQNVSFFGNLFHSRQSLFVSPHASKPSRPLSSHATDLPSTTTSIFSPLEDTRHKIPSCSIASPPSSPCQQRIKALSTEDDQPRTIDDQTLL
ncbi:uncharacterized protein BYT42DRAFT_606797 [Radiomyces spectabilis]|uniref:uncharacterized protein n=1 Tax=Radiomyces spectabilis TaxID=64574 RepID=UPI00221F8E2F|nr:uncharacterized protein BYT42DRAFT_606797 [Radiomyces spectabilis]KAI8372960.1 hypothetical protein BYT42DRAFT_606797 [Radiomyces spectabilis]